MLGMWIERLRYAGDELSPVTLAFGYCFHVVSSKNIIKPVP
jgi:hypothetical protein